MLDHVKAKPPLRGGASGPDGPCAALTWSARGAGRAKAFASTREATTRKELIMLRIYTTILDSLRGLRPLVAAIERHDRDLARQLRRAASSIALNVQEGSGSHGGTRRERYRNALGSARETGACLDVAMALGYIEEVDAALLDRLDKIRATLVKNVL